MQVTVNIEDSKLSELVSNGIETIDAKTIGAIAKDAIKAAFANTGFAQRFVYRINEYGSIIGLQPWIESAVQKSMTEKDVDEFKNILLEVFKTDAKSLIITTLADTLTRNLFTFDNQAQFRENLLSNLRQPETY